MDTVCSITMVNIINTNKSRKIMMSLFNLIFGNNKKIEKINYNSKNVDEYLKEKHKDHKKTNIKCSLSECKNDIIQCCFHDPNPICPSCLINVVYYTRDFLIKTFEKNNVFSPEDYYHEFILDYLKNKISLEGTLNNTRLIDLYNESMEYVIDKNKKIKKMIKEFESKNHKKE